MSMLARACVAAALCGGLSVAQGSQLTLNYEETSSGTTAFSTAPNSLIGQPTSFYGNSFTPPAVPLAPIAGTPPGPVYNFYDDFVFTTSPAAFDSVTATIDLGSLSIANFSVRLYNAAGNTLPVLGTPSGNTLLEAWSSPLSGTPGVTGTVAVLNDPTLAGGTYVLEVRGDVASAGGSYSGSLNVQPVPLPAALPLILSGLGLVGGVARRRRKGS